MTYTDQILTLQQRASEVARQEPQDWRTRSWLRGIHEKCEELQRRAAKDFAALNGWHLTNRWFAVSTLAAGRVVDEWFVQHADRHRLFDHAVYFRLPSRPYRPVAIVGEPYDTNPRDARIAAAELGLELHVPPKLTAGWWYPGLTRFFCFTRPGTPVRFLPEQESDERR